MSATSYYSYLTQAISNGFASWMSIRQDKTSIGQQFLNTFGIQLQDITRAFNAAQRGLFLVNADINVADVLQVSQLPPAVPLDPNSLPVCIGDGHTLIPETDLDTFLYKVPPTRITQLETDATSLLTFTDILAYDIPFIYPDEVEKPIFFQFNTSTNQLMKYHSVDELLERPLENITPRPGIEVLQSYTLLNTSGSAIAGTYKGACLYLDTLLILFGQTLYVYDVRVSLNTPITPGWVGNQEQTSIQALAQFTISPTIGNTPTGLAFDPRATFFWIKNGNSQFIKFQLNYDYVIFDLVRNRAFFREVYSALTVGGVSFTQEIHDVWNYFDEFGLLLNTPRLEGESNQDYQTRLLNIFKFRSNSTVQGIVDAVSLDLDLNVYGYFPSGQGAYPTNLFPTGEFPSGFPIYASGLYPSGVGDIAKINALFDPPFYSGVIDAITNIPSAEMVDYTKEILSTFPIVWGSGTGDPIGFIWDLSPFDGGLNNTAIAPDYFALINSGIPSIWYQSGVKDPSTDDLEVRMIDDIPTDDWIPQIFNGDFFINNKLYHLYALAGYETIPSGVNPYTVLNSGAIQPGFPITIVDRPGHTAPSGTQYLQVNTFNSGSPYEFIYTSGQISFNNPQNGLEMWYETNPSGWFTIPGWDFNPTHAALDDGFIWISDVEQVVSPSGYTLRVFPDVLNIGGGTSVLEGTLLDVLGDPVVGATAHFRLHPSGLGTISNSEALTGLDGNAFSLYSSPTTIGIFGNPEVSSSGNTIVVSGTILTSDLQDIWTVKTQSDVSGYPDPVKVLWLQKNATVQVDIQSTDWAPLNPNDANLGNFAGVYTIGGTTFDNIINGTPFGDDLFNIALNSIQENDGGTWNNIPQVASGNGFPRQYDVDNYRSPQDYGKVNLYTVIIPSGDLSVRFDTYAPVHPIVVQPNIPSSGLTTLTYNATPDPSGTYTVYAPLTVQIESWATWQNTDTLHEFADITMQFPEAAKGVFRLDDKFVDYISYLRFI